MQVRRPEGYVTDPWNVRMDETGRKLKKWRYLLVEARNQKVL
jgi:hypothetical protein